MKDGRTDGPTDEQMEGWTDGWKNHTCEEGGTHFRISKLEKQIIIEKLLKWANKKQNNFNIYNVDFSFFKKKKKIMKNTCRYHYQNLDDMNWPSGFRRCNKNRKVPGSKPARHPAGLRDPISLRGSR